MAGFFELFGLAQAPRVDPNNEAHQKWVRYNASMSSRKSNQQNTESFYSEAAADAWVAPGSVIGDVYHPGGMGPHLGLFSTTSIIIGRIIGTGIFSTPSSVTEGVGSVGAALTLWIIGLILSFCGLFVWLEFGAMFPRSGGEKVYLEVVYKQPKLLATTLFGTHAVLLGFTAAGCIIFANNILLALNMENTGWISQAIAALVITWITAVHTFTPRVGVWIMNGLSSLKVLLLLFIVFTGAAVLCGCFKSVPDPYISYRQPFLSSTSDSGSYATALFKILSSYLGWGNASYVLSEVRRPVPTLKTAGPLGLGICGVLYILANIAYYAVLEADDIKNCGVTMVAVFTRKVYGETTARVISACIAMSALGNVMTVTFAQSRVNQELAKEGVLPFGRFWASSWPAGAPSSGLLLHFIPSFIVIVCVPKQDAYDFILSVEGYPIAIINFFVVLGLFLLRRRAPYLPRPFKVCLAVPAVYICAQIFLITAPFIRPANGEGDTSLPYWLYPIVGILVLLSGACYWCIWRILMPKFGGFRWVDRNDVLLDGTVVRHFVKEKTA